MMDDGGVAVSGARVLLEGTGVEVDTDNEGKYTLVDLSSGTYVLKVSATGFLGVSKSIALQPGEILDENVTLSKAVGVANVYGIVRDQANNVVEGATVSYGGPMVGQVFTNVTGEYISPSFR